VWLCGSGYGGEKTVHDNGSLYVDIRQAAADIEQLSLLGRQLDMPVCVTIISSSND